MSGKTRYCEICGIKKIVRGGFFANFPIDELRCRNWVRQVGKEDLVHVPIEKLHAIRHVCGDHFERRDFGKTGKRLKKRAFPKLHLTAPPLSDHQLSEFPQHVASKAVANPTVPVDVVPVESTAMLPMPSTSREPLLTSVIQNLNVSTGAKPEKRPCITKSKSTKKSKISHADDAPIANPTVPVDVVPVESPAMLPMPSTSREPLSTSVIQNLNVPTGAKPEKRPCITKSKSTKKSKISHADDAPIANPTVPVDVVPVESPAMLPMPSTSREPLSTSVIQNLNVPAVNPIVPDDVLPVQPAGMEPMPSTSKECLLTPPSQHLNDCNTSKNKLLKQLKEMKSTIKSLKKNAKVMEKLESPFLKELVNLALKNQNRKPRGHRWTTKYKISCLAILKRSPKAYKYLQHLVPVPNIKTLQNILQKVPMAPGISPQILEHLRKAAAVSSKTDKYCCLLFDEIAIKPRLNYNIKRDNVDGFTDMGDERENTLADHALVFMLQGIRKKFKQPLAFYFVKGTVSSEKLAEIIKKTVQAIHGTGFHVIATVCDQGPTNMGALKILREGPEEGPSIKNYFNVDGRKIFIIYDVPHLFKSLRNNLMNYGEMKMGGKAVKWAHLKEVEEKNKNLLYLSKITQNHVEPKYRGKMKVKYAAQALSNTVAAVLKLLSLAEHNNLKKKELNESGEVIHELDKLFDVTNGPSGPHDIKKGQRENVSAKTKHLAAWTHYRKILETAIFQKESGVRAKNVRCIQGYLTTLCSLRDVWTEVQRLGFKYLNLRQLNQDALENLFGVLRQHSPTNRNPTVTSFVAALKTAVISGMSAPHSRGSNCEKDANLLLTDLHNFVFESGTSDEANKENVNMETDEGNEDLDYITLHIPEEQEEDDIEANFMTVEDQPIVYVSGYLAKTVFKIHDCSMCQKSLATANPNDPKFIYIKLREWWEDRSTLTYPNTNLCVFVEKCVTLFEKEVIPMLHQNNICNKAVTLFMAHCDGGFIKCDVHRSKIFHLLSSKLAVLLIRRQCQRINKQL